MGSPAGEGFPDEQPQHEVKFAVGFFVGKHEVTAGAFAAFLNSVESNECGARRAGGMGRRHVVEVTRAAERDLRQIRAYVARVGEPAEGLGEPGCALGRVGEQLVVAVPALHRRLLGSPSASAT